MAAPRRKTSSRRPRPGSSDWKKSENWADLKNFAGNSLARRSRQSGAIFVWCRAIGDFVVNRNYRPAYQGWAVILLSAAVLGLGGCGRKGGLDLPPNAASQSDTNAAASINPDAEKAAQP